MTITDSYQCESTGLIREALFCFELSTSEHNLLLNHKSENKPRNVGFSCDQIWSNEVMECLHFDSFFDTPFVKETNEGDNLDQKKADLKPHTDPIKNQSKNHIINPLINPIKNTNTSLCMNPDKNTIERTCLSQNPGKNRGKKTIIKHTSIPIPTLCSNPSPTSTTKDIFIREASHCNGISEVKVTGLKHRRCEETGCGKWPTYGYEGGKSRFCLIHKLSGMIDVKNRRCEHFGCKTRPSYGFEGERPKYCLKHKAVGMSDQRNRKCDHHFCTKRPIFSFPGQKSKFCKDHKQEGMHSIISKRCANQQDCSDQLSLSSGASSKRPKVGPELLEESSSQKNSDLFNESNFEGDTDSNFSSFGPISLANTDFTETTEQSNVFHTCPFEQNFDNELTNMFDEFIYNNVYDNSSYNEVCKLNTEAAAFYAPHFDPQSSQGLQLNLNDSRSFYEEDFSQDLNFVQWPKICPVMRFHIQPNCISSLYKYAPNFNLEGI